MCSPLFSFRKHNYQVHNPTYFVSTIQLFQIPVVAGDNLMDHLFVDVPFLVNDSISISPKEIGSWRATLEYEIFGTGTFTHLSGTTFLCAKSLNLNV